MTATDDRLPPFDLAAERTLLGGVLRDPDVLPAVVLVVAAGDFYFDAHQRVFRALVALDAARRPIDLVTVHDALRAAGETADVGGAAYLADLWEAAATGANAEYHAGVVRDHAVVRRLIRTANEVLRDCFHRVGSAEELVAAAEQRVRAVADDRPTRTGPRPIGEVCRDILAGIDARAEGDAAAAGLPTGLADLDSMLGGLKPGHLVAVGARTSVGKTALALNLAVNVALGGTPVLVFSLEMTAEELAARVLAMDSGVPTHRFDRAAKLSPPDAVALGRAAGPDGVGGCPIWVDDTPGQTAARLTAGLRRAVARHRVGLAVVDYLQLVTPGDRRESRATQVAELSRALKLMARECGVPVVVLAQLNRESERENRKPRLSDFRESGGIEQDCDEVILLHRQPDQRDDAPVWLIDADVAKHRNGPTGEVTLAYRRAVVRFENAAKGPANW